ncbi:CdaR family protein [Agathobaculum sp. LCP25S3_E8]|uniref:CdaR family protein n=1 Tax=Agathobaculum sp. LCP25S3_E8 TaxID=3438735 RepID=UPI003F8E30D8
MKQFMKKHDIWLRLLSILLAFVLWIVVRDIENPIKPTIIRDVPVKLVGTEQLMNNYNLSVIEYTTTIDVRVEGPNNEITDSTFRKKVSATIDVSGITDGAGEYALTPQITTGSYNVDSTGTEPSTVRVLVDKVTTETVPVRVETTGTAADGSRPGTPEPTTTKEVTISGPEAELKEVAYAYGTIDVTGKSSTFTGECSIALYNDAGEPITGTHVTCQTDTITVRVPIYPVESVPLTVSLTDGETLKEDQVNVSINPSSITLIGDQKTLAGITEINLGTIALDDVRTGVPVEMEIPLPEGVRLDNGQPSTAEVTISVKEQENVSTRKIQVTKFVPTDTAQAQTPYSVSVLTESVEIELRGSESALQQVDLNSLSIGLTFDSVSLGLGTHRVKGVVAATGLPSGVTLVGGDVEVEIEITGPDGEETVTPPDTTDTTDATQDDGADTDAVPSEKGGDGI